MAAHRLSRKNMILCSSVKKQLITSDLQRHRYIVCKQLSRSQSLRHGYIVAIDIRGELRDGIQADISIKKTKQWNSKLM